MTTDPLRQALEQCVTALKAVHPYTDSLVCYASTVTEHPPNGIPLVVQQALAAAREVLAQTRQVQPARLPTDNRWYENKGGKFVPVDAETEKILAKIVAPKACPYCDDTGDIHTITGEWRGVCICPEGQKHGPNAKKA